MWSWIITLLISAYPARLTYQCLHKPVRGGLRHWCIFWLLFTCLDIIEPLGSNFIPFWQFIKTGIIIINYSPSTSEITYKSIKGLINHCSRKWQKDTELQQSIARVCDNYIGPCIQYLETNVVPLLPLFVSPLVGGALSGLRTFLPAGQTSSPMAQSTTHSTVPQHPSVIGPYKDSGIKVM